MAPCPPRPHRVALGLALAALVGCATLPPAPVAHHILVHKEGDAINGDRKKLTPDEFRAEFVTPILDGIARHVASEPEPARIMLFVHGGLNTYRAGLNRVNELAQFREDTDPGQPRRRTLVGTSYYPVFINWNSSLRSSLWSPGSAAA